MALKYSKLCMFNVLGLYVNETMSVQNRSKLSCPEKTILVSKRKLPH